MLDRAALCAAIERHGRVVRVAIVAIAGSSPREVGAAMLVWRDGGNWQQSGTIGGGALEHQASLAARRHLEQDTRHHLSRHPLGPELGQCCGGAVTLLTEVYDAARLDEIPVSGLFARGPGAAPLTVARALAQGRDGRALPGTSLHGDWVVEPLLARDFAVWIWGAGHVGRALVDVLSPLPEIGITWVDIGPERFPDDVPEAVICVPAAQPVALVPHAPPHAHHLILTYSHALDLELCHAVLGHPFASAGLIGSATKWARFRKRLAALGHSDAQIARIACPIGDPGLGKHPQAIAVGVARDFLHLMHHEPADKEKQA